MARTWTLHATLTGLSESPNVSTRLVTDTLFQNLYFCNSKANDVALNTVYEWDGTTVTDLGFHTWLNANYSATAWIGDMAWFGGTLYMAFSSDSSGGEAHVARWDGGTTWTEVFGPVTDWGNIDGTTQNNVRSKLVSDSTRICLVYHTPNFAKMYASTNGTSWSLQQISAADIHAGYYNLSADRSRYASVLMSEMQAAIGSAGGYKVIEPAWTRLSGSDIGDYRLVGYGDSKSFFTGLISGSDHGVFYSPDWGVTLNAAGGPTENSADLAGYIRVFNIADDVLMLCDGLDDVNAYTWNFDTDEFVTDGTAGGFIYGFFKLGSSLYALCAGATGTSARIYTSGSIEPSTPNARFYFAPAGQPLTEKFTLPFAGVAPGGMTVDRTLGRVVIGSDAPSTQPVVYSTYPYVTGTATYDGFPTGTAVQSLKWV